MADKEFRPFRYFNAEVIRVIDGDTIEATLDIGFRLSFRSRFRLLGVDTPERRRETMEAFHRATEFTQKWCDEHSGHIEVETCEEDNFGRWLALFRCQKTGEYLNKRLIDEGHSPDDYRGGLSQYLRSPVMLVENINQPGLREATRLAEIGYLDNRTKGRKGD